jgi:ribokinase
MAQVVVIGSTMTDMIAYVDKVPEAGQTLVGNSFALGFGGKGANQAVMARRFGADVSMINSVGSDLFAKSTLENFEKEGISTKFIRTEPGSSGIAPIWVDSEGNNRIIIIPGANNLMDPKQGEAALANLPDEGVIVGQFEIPQEVTAAAFKAAKKKNMITILNPAPFAPINPELIKYSDYLIPNESEFAALDSANRQPDSESVKAVGSALGCKLIVTLGEKGVGYIDGDGEYKIIAAAKVNAIDTTGAGDAFIGAFAFALANKWSETDALKLACQSASQSVTKKGTQTSYPTKEEAQIILNNFQK